MRQDPFWKGAKRQEIDDNLQVLGARFQIPIPLDGTFPPARSAFRQCPVQSCLRNQRLANLITCCFVFRIQA